MNDTITFTIDGREVRARKGQTIIAAAEEAGIYIPRLCYAKDVIPAGACRVCTVLVNGRPQAACTQPAANGMVVQSETPEIQDWRKAVVEMLFVEGNHYCMFCEKSGNCQLQAVGYRMGMTAPRYPFQFPDRAVDASHPDVLLDRNRCILCGLCVTASRTVDGKNVFGFLNRSDKTEIGVNADQLAGTDLEATDKAVQVCPVGAILKKRVGFAVPIGQRLYDENPVGSNIEKA
jgi:[NiFe] hydrogenase diaphorase moiety small subunit